jgi:hypothetical protein
MLGWETSNKVDMIKKLTMPPQRCEMEERKKSNDSEK